MADCCSITMLGYLAIIFILYRVYKMLRTVLYPYIVQKRLLGHFMNFPGYGKWAVVTGSTDGIGKGYAKELAKREELSRKNIEVRTLAFDFGTATLETYQVIKDALKNLEVGVLINNVGIANDYPEYYVDYPDGEKFWKSMIDINCFAATEMTYIVLPQMLQRHKGIVVNVSSAAGFRPTGLYTIYSATKTFMSFFTKGLIEEYKDSGIIFQCVYPYYVATKLSKVKQANFFAPDPDYYASSALDTVGIESETVGCLSHALQHVLLELMPSCLFNSMKNKMSLKKRDKYLAKAEKNK